MAKEDFANYDQAEEFRYQSQFGRDPRAYDKFNELMAEIDMERDYESLSHMPGYHPVKIDEYTTEWVRDV
jgi:aminopeptidase N